MINNYDFLIAGLRIRISSPFEFTQWHEMSSFAIPYDAETKPDAHYALNILPKDWHISGQKVAQSPHGAVYAYHNELHYYYQWNVFSEDYFILLKRQKDEQSIHTIYLQEESLHRLLPQFRLASFLAPEQMLLPHQAFLLHAAVVDWNGKGILFTGPSGIGKSTQATLWEQVEGAQIINGDRAIIRRHCDGIKAWGSPYAGTSGIYKNLGVTLHAIVVLSQGAENQIKAIDGIAAFRTILQESTTQPWSPAFMSDLSDLILNITAEIPVYHLTCTPTADAVEILKKTLSV